MKQAMRRPPRPALGPASGPMLGLMLGLTLGFAGSAVAQSAATPPPAEPGGAHERTTATSVLLGYETLRLRAGERLGLAGGALLLAQGGEWWLGPAVYGAASGERGGLFVLGAELQRRFSLAGGTALAGLFAGGGGGASAPVGGGLMLRPTLAWLTDLGPLQAGLGISAVRFPSGDISSRQLSLLLAWDGRFRHAAPERAGSFGSDTERSGLGADRVTLTFGSYALRGAGVAERRVGLVGARGEREWGGSPAAGERGRWALGLEAAAAASGGAAGYMEILGTAGYQAPLALAGALSAGWRAAIGLGGGGGLPTAGGPLGKLAVNASYALGANLSTGIEGGWMQALDSGLHAPFVQWTLALALEPRAARLAAAEDAGRGDFARTEWTAALQRTRQAARQDGSARDLDTLGLKIARYGGEHWYATAQAHSAVAGGAGAYAVGLLGLGVASSARGAAWRAGAELLAGAAGGGGVASGGGAIVQALAWLGGALPGTRGELEWRLGAGGVRSRQPGLASAVLELSLTRAFAQLVPR